MANKFEISPEEADVALDHYKSYVMSLRELGGDTSRIPLIVDNSAAMALGHLSSRFVPEEDLPKFKGLRNFLDSWPPEISK